MADQILSKLKELNYYQLPPELVRELKDDCPECGGTGKDYGADPPVKIPIPCSNCKDGKVGEPHLERLVELDEDQSLPKIEAEPHNFGVGCPHCGEEVGTASEVEIGMQIYQDKILKANFKRIKE